MIETAATGGGLIVLMQIMLNGGERGGGSVLETTALFILGNDIFFLIKFCLPSSKWFRYSDYLLNF